MRLIPNLIALTGSGLLLWLMALPGFAATDPTGAVDFRGPTEIRMTEGRPVCGSPETGTPIGTTTNGVTLYPCLMIVTPLTEPVSSPAPKG